MKTVRFTQVVKECGRPEVHTVWTDANDDAELQRAVKQHRVVTVHQETVGAKADYGTVGFSEDRQGQFLLFPKSVRAYTGRKIVGVKYDLLEAPPVLVRPKPPKARSSSQARKEKPKAPTAAAPAPKRATPREEKIVPFPAREVKTGANKPELRPEPLRLLLHKAMKALKSGKQIQAYGLLQEIERILP